MIILEIFQTAITAFTVYNLVQCMVLIRACRKDTEKMIDTLTQKNV